jgi:carboxylesterase type B
MYPPRHVDARYTAIEMGSDYFFYCSGMAVTKELTSQNVSTQVFLFNHSPMVDVPNSFPACSNNNSCHSAELSFVWGTYRFYPLSNRNENERNLSTEMMNTIANFAHDKPISLPKYDVKRDEIWGFAPAASKILKDYRSKECKMWDRIGGYFNQ